jgi:tRNA A-37 threonylcarbamoyl transferase component Bud32
MRAAPGRGGRELVVEDRERRVVAIADRAREVEVVAVQPLEVGRAVRAIGEPRPEPRAIDLDAPSRLARAHAPIDRVVPLAVVRDVPVPRVLDPIVQGIHRQTSPYVDAFLGGVPTPLPAIGPAITPMLPSATLIETGAPTEPAFLGPGDEPYAPMPGERLGRYVVLHPLGAGGMGTVVAAHDPELDRSVAIKLVRAGFWTDASDAARAQLRREAQAMARLAHPNVVGVHDVGATPGGHLFLAMQLVPGVPLDQWLRRPRTWREILDVCLGAGRGLAAAHKAGLVHRDVKPGNILVDGEGTPRLCDFGLAAAGAATVDAACGTAAYMALEQHLGTAADARSDQFAFAVTTFEALYGRRPYAGDTKQAIADAIADARLALPSRAERRGTPRHVEVALARALAPAARDRYASMDDLLGALAAPPRARRIARVAAAVVVAGVAAAGLVLGAAQSSGAPPRHTGDPAVAYAALIDAAGDAAQDGRLDEARAALRAAIGIAARADLGDEAARAWAQLVDVGGVAAAPTVRFSDTSNRFARRGRLLPRPPR